MVLRGAQFQRSGPAGCTFLARQALFAYPATLVQKQVDGRSNATGEPHFAYTAGTTPRRSVQVLLLKDSRCLARAGDLCHGHIGESSSAS